MKHLFIPLSLFLFLTGCGALQAVKQPDFYFAMTLKDEEVSEDSNSEIRTITVSGYEGKYQWLYDGYQPNDDFDTDRAYSFTLNDEELHDLELLIRENGLLVDGDATVSTGEPWSAFDVTWSVSIAGQSAMGHVTGEPIAWEDWNAAGHDSVAEDETLFAAEQVDDFVKEKVGFSY